MELSQEHLAHEAGLTVRHYAKLEKGGTNPTLETLFNVAAALDLDILELMQLAARQRKGPARKK
jgi:transcriptional regulator with XRE-family HTH domain